MIPLYTASESRAAEERSGLAVELLMENAGAALARAALATGPGPYLLLCGKGHNGGDGLVCARHLRARGAEALVVQVPFATADVAGGIERAGTIVDCLLGTGFRGPVKLPLADTIERINASGKPVLACDLPSGLDADGGPVDGPCVRATRTLCMLGVKRGCVVYPGVAFAGVVECDPLGVLPPPAGAHLLEADDARAAVPPRRPEGHKGTFGSVAVLAGSPDYSGAPALVAKAVLAAGAGLCFLGVPDAIRPQLAAKLDEVILRPRDAALLAHAAAAVVGPGLGAEPGLVSAALASGLPLVLDADGLNVTDLATIADARGPVVITPHPGEMARLLGMTPAEVQADRFAAASRAAREGRCIAVLKGARTVIADAAGRLWVNPTGNDGMATAGTGDVLAGLIGGLLGQGAAPGGAALAGVYLHGLAGDLAAAAKGRYALVAGDLLTWLAEAMRRIGLG